MVKDWLLKILFFKTLPSTQLYLKELLKVKKESLPLAVVADIQTDGIGSRNNSWISEKGNLFLSFSLPLKDLPIDLKLESASIYFSFLLKESLESLGSKVFLKWPNDLYIDDAKVGGMITTVVNNNLICGVGLNLIKKTDNFAKLDIDISREEILDNYLINIEKKSPWKQVFSKYKLDFQINQKFFTHINKNRVSLSGAVLENDGSLTINGERIYSLR